MVYILYWSTVYCDIFRESTSSDLSGGSKACETLQNDVLLHFQNIPHALHKKHLP